MQGQWITVLDADGEEPLFLATYVSVGLYRVIVPMSLLPPGAIARFTGVCGRFPKDTFQIPTTVPSNCKADSDAWRIHVRVHPDVDHKKIIANGLEMKVSD